MATNKDSSRIPRPSDGISGPTSRIPMPGSVRAASFQQKCQMLPPTKLTRPLLSTGIRSPGSVMCVARKIESESLLSKKSGLQKFPSKLERNDNNEQDETYLLDKNMKEDVNQKLVTNNENVTKGLARSETFIRDTTISIGSENPLNITQIVDVIGSAPACNSTPKVGQQNLLCLARCMGGDENKTVTLFDGENSFLANLDSKTIDRILNFNDTTNIDRHLEKTHANVGIERGSDDMVIKFAAYEDLDRTLTAQTMTFNNSAMHIDGDKVNSATINLSRTAIANFDDTIPLAPDKAKLKLALNSTLKYDCLLDLTQTPSRQRQLMNITNELSDSPIQNENTTQLLYMTQDAVAETTLLAPQKHGQEDDLDEDSMMMDIDEISRPDDSLFSATFESAVADEAKQLKPRYSFGFDFTERTLDCSIDLVESSLASTEAASSAAGNINPQTMSPSFKKENSFEMDESLGILTPDQMKDFLDSNTTNTNLDLPFNFQSGGGKLGIHHMRIDQTPSPEDLPLDPVGVKTEITDVIMAHSEFAVTQSFITSAGGPISTSVYSHQQELSQTDTDSKTDQMTKSNVSKVSNSFITSVTSITSLDTGYQGDGEMSRPASRGAVDHSPSNGAKKPPLGGRRPSFNQQNHNIPIRRQDPMTDSDFFTESDADDIFHRGDRRAQVIDGQLYGPMLQPSNVFITEQPQMEDSCMESSGIFTDVENRCDDDLAERRTHAVVGDVDMSPDGSTDTVKSNNTEYSQQHNQFQNCPTSPQGQVHRNSQLTDSQTSSTMLSSCERLNEAMTAGSIASIVSAEMKLKSPPSTEAHDGMKTNSVSPPLGTAHTSVGGGKAKTVVNNSEDKKSPRSHSRASGGDRIGSIIAVNNSSNRSTSKTPHSLKKNSSPRKQHSHDGGSNTHATYANNKNNVETKVITISRSKSSVTAAKNFKETSFQINATNDFDSNSKPKIYINDLKNSLTPINGNKTVVMRQGCGENSADSSPKCVVGGSGGPKSRDDNQENKRPARLQQNANSVTAAVARQPVVNKWDVVMNKIDENKVLVKKNYSDVKSKVASGFLKRASPKRSASSHQQQQIQQSGQNRPASVAHSDESCGSCNSSSTGLPSSPQTKRIFGVGGIKRNRSASSHQSSRSDVNLAGKSQKLHEKSSENPRSAKKRDVRTLSISPTDLGPPPKTNGSVVSANKQATLQKRITPNGHHTVLSSTQSLPPGTKSAALTAKKLAARRATAQPTLQPTTQQTTHTKSPLKDHNRLASQHITQQQNGSSKTGFLPSIVTGTKSSSPCVGGKTAHSSPASTHELVPVTNKKPSTLVSINTSTKSEDHRPPNDHYEESNYGRELQQNNDPPPEHIQQLEHSNKTVAALGILLNYLAFDLDAFSGPSLKKEYERVRINFIETKRQLENVQATVHDLQDQIHDKESYYTTRESELQAFHRCELEKVENSLKQLEVSSSERTVTSDKRLNHYVREAEKKYLRYEQQIQENKTKELELLSRINTLTATENELRDRVQEAENDFAERLRLASLRERELTEKLNALTKQLNAQSKETEDRERALEEKLDLSHHEISILRHSRNYANQTISPKNGSLSNDAKHNGANKMHMLEDEVESLRCVLELKQREISELRKNNQELQRAVDQSTGMYAKASALESRVEDLQLQLKARAEEEKELIQRNKNLQDSFTHEAKNCRRLAQHNEELQYRLKQNAEKFSQTLSELSKSYLNQSTTGHLNVPKHNSQLEITAEMSSQNSSLTSLNRTTSSDRCLHMDDVSPPGSPIIKSVVEKSDSVSWILEMDDETPEAIASRFVRRASSFRANFNERSPGTRRQMSMPTGLLNPLTQSASAASVLRHSNEITTPSESGLSTARNIPNGRTRSQSVTMNKFDKKNLSRQNSTGSSQKPVEFSSSWKEPRFSSSPLHANNSLSKQNEICSPCTISPVAGPSRLCTGRRRSPSLCTDEEDEIFSTPIASASVRRNLITCDTSALLTAAEHFERRSCVPAHPSVQELKGGRKKCIEIQESAGEAMVSGTNSEDEGCSASSDEPVSSSSSAQTSSDGKADNLSMDHVIFIDKLNTSFGGTPMEVSWSEDGEHLPSESIV